MIPRPGPLRRAIVRWARRGTERHRRMSPVAGNIRADSIATRSILTASFPWGLWTTNAEYVRGGSGCGYAPGRPRPPSGRSLLSPPGTRERVVVPTDTAPGQVRNMDRDCQPGVRRSWVADDRHGLAMGRGALLWTQSRGQPSQRCAALGNAGVSAAAPRDQLPGAHTTGPKGAGRYSAAGSGPNPSPAECRARRGTTAQPKHDAW